MNVVRYNGIVKIATQIFSLIGLSQRMIVTLQRTEKFRVFPLQRMNDTKRLVIGGLLCFSTPKVSVGQSNIAIRAEGIEIHP